MRFSPPHRPRQILVLTIALLSGAVWLCCTVPPRAATLDVHFTGIDEDQRLSDYIGKNVKAPELPKHATESDIEYEAVKTRVSLTEALKAQGYYDADVEMDIEPGKDPSVSFKIDKGTLATIGSIRFDNGVDYPIEGLNVGDPLIAPTVLNAQKKLFTDLSDKSCLFDLDVTHTAILDTATQVADLVFHVTDKGRATLGAISFKGLDRVKEDHARRLLSLEPGSCYKGADIEAAQADLLKSGLFSTVRTRLPDQPDANGTVPVTIVVRERKHRTLRAGVSYYTDEGPGVSVGWEHRNFFGRGEKLTTEAKISALEQSLNTSFKKPFFLRKDQSLDLSAQLKREDTDAYDALTLGANGVVSRQLTDHLTVGLGGGYELSQITDADGEDVFALLSGIGYTDYDDRDSNLDPHKGIKARLDLEPFIDTFDPTGTIFWRTQGNASTYFAFAPDSRVDPVLALRGRLGSILGPDVADIPATKRFYAGGGGSVRGFGYQDIGPRDDHDDPAGGRSVVETSVEARVKFTSTIGGVAFLDGGSVSDAVIPDMGEGYAVGAGLGLRYYTDFGPLRFDVGVPVTQKENASAAFQIYVSIGQAF